MTTATITAYKLTPDEMLDVQDALHVSDMHVILHRCKGERIISDGYCCPHCGSGDPRESCGAPRDSVIGKPIELDIPYVEGYD